MKEPVPPFNHREAISKIAAKHGYDEKIVNSVVNMFFSKWGIMYFFRRFQFPYIQKVFHFKASGRTWHIRCSSTEKQKLAFLRQRDKEAGRPTNY